MPYEHEGICSACAHPDYVTTASYLAGVDPKTWLPYLRRGENPPVQAFYCPYCVISATLPLTVDRKSLDAWAAKEQWRVNKYPFVRRLVSLLEGMTPAGSGAVPVHVQELTCPKCQRIMRRRQSDDRQDVYICRHCDGLSFRITRTVAHVTMVGGWPPVL